MSKTRFKKSQWRNGIWVTRVALVFGVVAVGVGIANSSLLQNKVFGFLAIAAMVLSALGILLTLWQIERRSRRLRDPIFWLSLLLNLVIIVVVYQIYRHGMSRPPLQEGKPILPPDAT